MSKSEAWAEAKRNHGRDGKNWMVLRLAKGGYAAAENLDRAYGRDLIVGNVDEDGKVWKIVPGVFVSAIVGMG